MSASNRNRGAAAELRVCKLLAEELGIECKRNLSQTRDGGADIRIKGFEIEVKWCKTLAKPAWWRQAVAQAKDGEPMVIYGSAHKGWRALINRHNADPLDAPIESAITHIREKFACWP